MLFWSISLFDTFDFYVKISLNQGTFNIYSALMRYFILRFNICFINFFPYELTIFQMGFLNSTAEFLTFSSISASVGPLNGGYPESMT